jgi:hypothetical protein
MAGPCDGTLVAPARGVGTFRYDVTATDRAGNTAVTTVNWRVVYPVQGLPTETLRAKGGSAIPVAFSLGGDRGLDVLAAGSPRSLQVSCSQIDGPTADAETTMQPGNRTLTYEADDEQYVYVWKTSKSWSGSCRVFELTLVDGSVHTFAVRFT